MGTAKWGSRGIEMSLSSAWALPLLVSKVAHTQHHSLVGLNPSYYFLRIQKARGPRSRGGQIVLLLRPLSLFCRWQPFCCVRSIHKRASSEIWGKIQAQLTQRQDGIEVQVSAPKVHALLSYMIYDLCASVLSPVKWECYTLYGLLW